MFKSLTVVAVVASAALAQVRLLLAGPGYT
jgi:hypothetical protein